MATPGNLLVSKLAHSETSKAKLSYGQSKASIGNNLTNLPPTHVEGAYLFLRPVPEWNVPKGLLLGMAKASNCEIPMHTCGV